MRFGLDFSSYVKVSGWTSERCLNQRGLGFTVTRLIYVDDGTRNGIEIAQRNGNKIAHDTLVIAGPISHGCILTLELNARSGEPNSAFKVELDPDYK